jgi:hypothetical protein
MTKRADEAAAIHLWTSTAPSFAAIRDHITACPDCAGANPQHVWHILTTWQRGITATHIRARR